MSQFPRSPRFWIDRLELLPHPEGGFFRQTYVAETAFSQSSLPPGFAGSRAASTAIYFLLEDGSFSAFHRIRSDELWHFYAGDALEVIVINSSGQIEASVLGGDAEQGQTFQGVVKAGNWFASRLAPGGSFALVGCTVSPGFHFDDFELARRDDLVAIYPQHRQLIEELTRG